MQLYGKYSLQFKPEEIAAVMKDFDEPGSLAPTGLHLAGTKYMVIQGEPGAVVRGKKVHFLITFFNVHSFLLFLDLMRDCCTL